MFYGHVVPQLSLFSADARPPCARDLAGLLCGPGQVVRFGAGDQARLSIVLADASRAAAVLAACALTGVTAHLLRTEGGATALRTAFRCDLVELARAWTRGAVKAVPAEWQLDGPALRLWVLAAGRPDERGGYLLASRPARPADAPAARRGDRRIGLPPARVGRGTALRISGTRRMRRLVELVGPVPDHLAASDWPRCWGRKAS